MTLTDAERGCYIAIRAKSDFWLNKAQELSPRGGSIAVGSEHTRAFLKGEALAVFLRHLGAGSEVAEAKAKDEAKLIARTWNGRREWQVHISDCAGDDTIRWARQLAVEVGL